MSVTKHYLNKEKTKYDWRAIAYIPTGEYDRLGKPIKQHKHVGYFSTKSEGEAAIRGFWKEFEAGTLELNKNATFEDVIRTKEIMLKALSVIMKATLKTTYRHLSLSRSKISLLLSFRNGEGICTLIV